ncbi:RNA polymerase RpoN-/SigL-like sigma 54 subunit [Clostridium algidicarnis DSM 15099]|uniref:RNA polymerase RpoN-/SigL-like sigma 54 subunit n=2 Tax=Clostridium algidicarnis TaxID=37659 RepID=A0A2S6G082_9CLOT|nr:RNA polymerase RpoN-/SigL-like sigma 54 subunit [Clostridium algidicarnis DSM 15099]
MKMDFSLNLAQEQKLIMTQQMQLSVKLLQMSSYDLQEYIENEFQENPILEVEYENKKQEEQKDIIEYKELVKYLEFDNYSSQNYKNYNEHDEISPFNFISSEKSLKEYLYEQVSELNEDDYTKAICEYIIESLDSKGYLSLSIEDIAKELKISIDTFNDALKIVQNFEPDGIGARNLKECLKIQMRKKHFLDDNICKIVDEHLQDLSENKYQNIAKALNITVKEAQTYGDKIKTLEPKPSRGFFTGEEVKYVSPDAYIRKVDDKYYIEMNESLMPRLSINSLYKDILNQEKDDVATEFVKEKINSAMFLIKSIEQRKSTIYKVIEKIIELQYDFFEFGKEYLKPMTLKQIAESLNMHESTISRAIKDKYIYTNKGTIKLKSLFTTGVYSLKEGEDISVFNIKKEMKRLIEKEDKNKPLSDQVICEKLSENGMNISRRTVAKYRDELQIKSSSKRKRF